MAITMQKGLYDAKTPRVVEITDYYTVDEQRPDGTTISVRKWTGNLKYQDGRIETTGQWDDEGNFWPANGVRGGGHMFDLTRLIQAHEPPPGAIDPHEACKVRIAMLEDQLSALENAQPTLAIDNEAVPETIKSHMTEFVQSAWDAVQEAALCHDIELNTTTMPDELKPFWSFLMAKTLTMTLVTEPAKI